VTDTLATALEAALARFDGASPVTEQVHYHFNRTAPTRRVEAVECMQRVLDAAAAAGGEPRNAVDAAVAVAILQQSAVVHADVNAVDGTSVRARYGLAHGINAGDALCALAYLQLLVDPAVDRPAAQRVAMTRALQEANYAHCGGRSDALTAAARTLGVLAAGKTSAP
jgi:geranylgeranyl pyrophosphate synthase